MREVRLTACGALGSVALARWRVALGEELEPGDVLCELETEKTVLELESPHGGKVVELCVETGAPLEAGMLLARIDSGQGSDGGQQRAATQVPNEGPAEEPLLPIEAVIARRLTQSSSATPTFHLTVSVDMSRAREHRDVIRAQSGRIGFNEMMIKALGLALHQYPRVAMAYRDGHLQRGGAHVGMAVRLEQGGLLVPVVRDADRKSLREITDASRELADRARAGRLRPQDLEGAALTLSNLGMFRVDRFTAIVGQNESAIVSVGAILDRPWVVSGEIVVRPVVEMTMGSDHRVIDGALAARFMTLVKALLEDPIRLGN